LQRNQLTLAHGVCVTLKLSTKQISMEWNRIAMAQKFLRLANGVHPDPGAGDFIKAQAQQDVYDHCYMASFSRDKVIEFLDSAAAGKIEVPEDVTDEAGYRKAFMNFAKKVRDDFQQLER
jgi:hypothetical protein